MLQLFLPDTYSPFHPANAPATDDYGQNHTLLIVNAEALRPPCLLYSYLLNEKRMDYPFSHILLLIIHPSLPDAAAVLLYCLQYEKKDRYLLNNNNAVALPYKTNAGS
ncbi:hypothetical protein D1872_188270 [compost metagenome]